MIPPIATFQNVARWDRWTGFFVLVASTFLGIDIALKSEIIFVAGAAISGLAGVMLFCPLITSFAEAFNPLRLFAASALGAYGLGAAMAWSFSHTETIGGFATVLAFYDSISISDLAIAQLGVNVFATMLMLGVKFLAPTAPEQRLTRQIVRTVRDPASRTFLVPLAYLLLLLQLVFLLRGSVAYRTFAASDVVDPTTLLVVTTAPLSALFAGILLGRCLSRLDGNFNFLLVALLIGVNSIWFFSQGRVSFLSACLYVLFGYVAVRPISLRRIFYVSVLIFAPLLVMVSVLLQNNRHFGWVDETGHANVFSALTTTTVESSRLGKAEKLEARANLSENLAFRPLFLNYPALLIAMRRSGDTGWLGLEEIKNSVLMALPRLLYRNKEDILIYDTLYSERLGLPYGDNAKSVYMSALLAFSFLGLPIFAFLAWLFVRLFSWAVLAFRSGNVLLLALASLISMGLGGGETGLITFLVVARNVLLLAFILAPLEIVYWRRRMVSPGTPQDYHANGN